MAVDDVATNPERIVAEIHRQLGDIPPPIPIFEIAKALDTEIWETELENFEGILVTDLVRDFGIICINSKSLPERRRFSVGHELGHFLCRWHVQTQDGTFQCSRRDMSVPTGDPVHIRQENEANLFAIKLLAPRRFFSPYVVRNPNLEHVLALYFNLNISKTAAARRYVSLHKQCVAAIFVKDGKYQYSERGFGFPFIRLDRGQPLPSLPKVGRDSSTSKMVEVNAEDWLGQQRSHELSVQTLEQAEGHAIVLLHLSTDRG